MAPLGRILQLILFSWLLAADTTAASQALPGCSDMCGNLSIPYPFGMTRSCYLNENFLITCNQSSSPPRPHLVDSNIVVTDITLEGQLKILNFVARDCYDAFGPRVSNFDSLLWTSMFTISNEKNKFTAIGCDTYATIMAEREGTNSKYFTGCMSYCDQKDNLVLNGSCSGIGCCQISIFSGLKNINISVTSYNNHSNVWDFNPCSYAFVTDQSKFTFSYKSFDELANIEFLPLVLDWAIGNQSCKVAENKTDYACKQHSMCYNLKNKSGYICKCKDGYKGNPYLPHGCQDIDECKNSSLHNCISERNCVNMLGNYNCSCSKGFRGDGRKDGIGCIPNELKNVIRLAIGICLGTVGLLFLLAGVWWLYRKLETRKNIKRKEELFKRNGGLLLQKKLSSDEGGVEKTKLFTSKELEKATDQYNENRILGCGGQGMVYKGMLRDGRIVAVKKSKIVNEGYLDQFINEIVILSQIDHRNVVKLLGCCLETEVPLLVYEFIPNGTLSQLIHDQNEEYPRSWDVRLRIAAEVASAIWYLHSSASVPIYHRDIKSSNILLDEKFRAKVSDFGTSRLISIDQTHLTTQVHGTFGYLDPEYFQSSQFTEKSDVYSFGVVLVELLTGHKPISTFGSQEKRGLVSYFITSMDENRLLDILDAQIVKDGQKDELVAIAYLAQRCLNLDGKCRPTMKEVAMELERIRIMRGYVPTQQKQEEFAATEPTENWEFTSSSNVPRMDSSTASVSDVHPLMIDTI